MRIRSQAHNTRRQALTYACLTTLATALSASPSAYAQVAGPSTTSTGIELVTVTAERRTTWLQKTPVAITALTANTIENNRIDTFADLSLRVPNLTYTQFSPQESYLSIRGTLINNNAAGWDDAVTTFIDGVPTTGLGDQNPDLFDLSEIEVLRGPQGTLFGRNVTGGAVVIHTLSPSFEFAGRAQVSYGNYNAVQARGYITGPITDTLAAKLSIDVNHRDAFIKNVVLGGKTDGTDEYDIRGQLLWNATPDLEVLLGADILNDNSGGYPSRLIANFRPVLFPNLSYDANTTNQGFNGFQHRQVAGGLARITWTNPFAVVTSITGYRNVNDHFPNSVLGDPENQLLQIGIVQDKQVTEEVDVTSPSDQTLTWVGGFFYLHSSKLQGGSLIFAFDPATVAGLFSADTHYTQVANQNVTTDSYAIFGEASYAITDSLKLTLGARETWERKSGVSTVSYSIIDPANLFPASAAYSHSWDAFTPKFNVSYQATDDLMLYVTVSRGFKSGGYDLSGTGASSSVDVALAFAKPFDPETLWSYEVGEKFTAFDNHLVVNGDLFRADYNKLQTSRLVLLPNNELANITSNAPGITTVQGVELESTAIPTDWLTIGLTYGYLDAYFADGTRVPYTPRHQINLTGDIHWPVPSLNGQISIAGDFTYHSRVLFNPGEVLPEFAASRTSWDGIVNLHADYTSDDSLWRVSVWGKNITDDRALLRASNIGVLFQTLPEFLNPNEFLYLVKYYPERTFGISVTRNF